MSTRAQVRKDQGAEAFMTTTFFLVIQQGGASVYMFLSHYGKLEAHIPREKSCARAPWKQPQRLRRC